MTNQQNLRLDSVEKRCKVEEFNIVADLRVCQLKISFFTTQRYANAGYAMVLCTSVRPSACPLQVYKNG